MSPIVAFLTGQGPDGAGRLIAEVLAFGDEALERHHDYIQWLFPLTAPSQAVPGSPVLSSDDIAALRASPLAQALLRAAARRMEAFYGRQDRWLRGPDHNHLRITRILRSLRLLAGDAEADAFKATILERAARAGDAIPAGARRFWDEA